MVPPASGVPSAAQLQRLRALRQRSGLSLEVVAERTGLPVAHVEALEEARVAELPAGPYVNAYYRLVLGVVGGDVDDHIAQPTRTPPEPRLPLWVVRGTALLSVLGLIAAAAWQIRTQGIDDVLAVTEAFSGSMVAARQLELTLLVRRESHFSVWVDGEHVLDRVLAPGISKDFTARERIEVELTGAEVAGIEYNGQPIVPQGRQGVPRRLVFIDDLSPGD